MASRPIPFVVPAGALGGALPRLHSSDARDAQDALDGALVLLDALLEVRLLVAFRTKAAACLLLFGRDGEKEGEVGRGEGDVWGATPLVRHARGVLRR